MGLLKALLVSSLLIVQGTKFKGKVLRRRFDYPDGRDQDAYYLRTGLDEFRLYGMDATLDDVESGSILEGDGTFVAQEESIVDVRNASVSARSSDSRNDLSTIAFVLNVCARQTANASDAYREKAKSLSSMFDSCSIGAARMTALVMDPIQVPCEGNTTYGMVYNASRCADREFVGWAQYAERYAKNILRVDLSKYPYRLFVVPYTIPGCNWLGLADVGGCGSADGCRAWIKGGPEGYNLGAAFHELGHNLGLRHAMGPEGDEYGDYTGAMGGCCDVRCHNAPQAWALGWNDLIVTLNETTRKSVQIALPAMLTEKASVVRVSINGSNTFLSYRTAMGYDSKLYSAGLVHVHSFNGSRTNKYVKSQLLALVPPGKSYVDSRNDWVMNVTAANGTHALVSLCRRTACDPCTGICGNGVCEAYAGETCETCPKDCVRGVTRWGPFCCGAAGQCKFHWRCSNQKAACETECPSKKS